MKEITTIKKVSLTYNELMQLSNVKANRCGYLKKAEAIENGFSEADWDKFIKRAASLKKTIKQKGFSKASFFVIAKDEEGNLYLLDGQGRRMALMMLHDNDHFDFSDWEFVCDLYVDPMSEDRMNKLIKEMNTGNKNWATKDLRRSDVIAANNESATEAFNEAKKLEDNYGITNYMANLLTFGEKPSHMRNGNTDVLTTSDYASTKEAFTEAYLKFVVNASYKVDRNGEIVERPKKIQTQIRNVNFGISFVGCLRDIVKYHNKNVEEAREDINYFVDKLLDACSGDDNFVKQFVMCDKKDKCVVANKVRSICSRKANLRNALYLETA